jgi:hypothetical protein
MRLLLLVLLLVQAAFANGIIYMAKTETNTGTNPTLLNSIYWARLSPGTGATLLCTNTNGEFQQPGVASLDGDGNTGYVPDVDVPQSTCGICDRKESDDLLDSRWHMTST